MKAKCYGGVVLPTDAQSCVNCQEIEVLLQGKTQAIPASIESAIDPEKLEECIKYFFGDPQCPSFTLPWWAALGACPVPCALGWVISHSIGNCPVYIPPSHIHSHIHSLRAGPLPVCLLLRTGTLTCDWHVEDTQGICVEVLIPQSGTWPRVMTSYSQSLHLPLPSPPPTISLPTPGIWIWGTPLIILAWSLALWRWGAETGAPLSLHSSLPQCSKRRTIPVPSKETDIQRFCRPHLQSFKGQGLSSRGTK